MLKEAVVETDMMLNLRKFLAPEIVYGAGALELAGRHAGNLGANRVLVVTDPGVRDAGWSGKVESSLEENGIAYMVFSDVTPNPKDHEVMIGAEVYHRQGCDLILAVGGGSPMDCAKGIGVVVGNGGHILEYEGVDEVTHPGPPLIFIPTTAGTSADVSQFCIVTDTSRRVKIAIISKMVIPDIALVDPETTCTMSPDLTAATGMDALCHAFEAYVSTAASPLTDMAAREAVRLISGNLVAACHESDNGAFRDKMMMASLMAGLAFSNASLGLVHAMAHSLGGFLGLAHGECNAILLERVVRFNYPEAAGRYADLASELGIEAAIEDSPLLARELVAAIADLRRRVGITQRLSDMGVAEADLPRLAGYAVQDPCLATNPREAAPEDVEHILREIY
jgi:alcohol dehydrogenase